MGLNRILTPAQIDQAIDALMGWPLRVTEVRGLFADAWRLRANVTFAEAMYVALTKHLGADLLLMMAAWPTLLACQSGCRTFPNLEAAGPVDRRRLGRAIGHINDPTD